MRPAFLTIFTGGHPSNRGSGALRTLIGQAPGLPACSARGAAEARRSLEASSVLPGPSGLVRIPVRRIIAKARQLCEGLLDNCEARRLGAC